MLCDKRKSDEEKHKKYELILAGRENFKEGCLTSPSTSVWCKTATRQRKRFREKSKNKKLINYDSCVYVLLCENDERTMPNANQFQSASN